MAIGTGTLLAGNGFDAIRAYTGLLIAAALMLSLGPYPDWSAAAGSRSREPGLRDVPV